MQTRGVRAICADCSTRRSPSSPADSATLAQDTGVDVDRSVHAQGTGDVSEADCRSYSESSEMIFITEAEHLRRYSLGPLLKPTGSKYACRQHLPDKPKHRAEGVSVGISPTRQMAAMLGVGLGRSCRTGVLARGK